MSSSLNPLDDLIDMSTISVEGFVDGPNTIKVRCLHSSKIYEGDEYFVEALLARLKQVGLTTINEAILAMEALNLHAEAKTLSEK